jgi:hypothetical protein
MPAHCRAAPLAHRACTHSRTPSYPQARHRHEGQPARGVPRHRARPGHGLRGAHMQRLDPHPGALQLCSSAALQPSRSARLGPAQKDQGKCAQRAAHAQVSSYARRWPLPQTSYAYAMPPTSRRWHLRPSSSTRCALASCRTGSCSTPQPRQGATCAVPSRQGCASTPTAPHPDPALTTDPNPDPNPNPNPNPDPNPNPPTPTPILTPTPTRCASTPTT